MKSAFGIPRLNAITGLAEAKLWLAIDFFEADLTTFNSRSQQ